MTEVGANGCYDGPEHPIVHLPSPGVSFHSYFKTGQIWNLNCSIVLISPIIQIIITKASIYSVSNKAHMASLDSTHRIGWVS